MAAEIKKSHEDDSFVDSLLFTQLADEATIIRKSPKSPFERSPFKSEFFQIQELRNQLAHAKEYALTLEAASRVCETVRLIDQWSSRLSRWEASCLRAIMGSSTACSREELLSAVRAWRSLSNSRKLAFALDTS